MAMSYRMWRVRFKERERTESRDTRGLPSGFLRKGLDPDIATKIDRFFEGEKEKKLVVEGNKHPRRACYRVPNAPLSESRCPGAPRGCSHENNHTILMAKMSSVLK